MFEQLRESCGYANRLSGGSVQKHVRRVSCDERLRTSRLAYCVFDTDTRCGLLPNDRLDLEQVVIRRTSQIMRRRLDHGQDDSCPLDFCIRQSEIPEHFGSSLFE